MRGLKMSGEMGAALPAVILFLFGFSILVASIYLWQKKEDNSFEKACGTIKDLKVDMLMEISKVAKSVTETAEAQKSMTSTFFGEVNKLNARIDEQESYSKMEHLKLNNQSKAHDLIIQRIKEQLHQFEGPVGKQEITLKQSEPIEISVVKRSKSGASPKAIRSKGANRKRAH